MRSLSTSDRILFRLKTHGPQSAQEVADHFGMSKMGAHKALQSLAEQGFVEFSDVAEGRGRPRRRFELTADGHARFPDHHADLTVEMLDDVEAVFGKEGLDRLIAQRERRQRERYAQPAEWSLRQKVEALADARAEEGYMARVETLDDGNLMLIEDHCPICAAAEACQGFCRSELAIFRLVLGPEVSVERSEHVLAGGRRCAYRITPAVAPAS